MGDRKIFAAREGRSRNILPSREVAMADAVLIYGKST
jgi:hypothetical protein